MDNQDQFPEHHQDSQGQQTPDHSQTSQNPNRQHSNLSNFKHLRRQRQRTSIVALGVLLAISMTLMSFDAPGRNDPYEDNYSLRGSKSLRILTEERERESPGLTTNLSNRFEEQKNADETTLRELNQLQANKINALKRQLVESNQKIHEVKAHLFTKGDPADRSRLAEICQELLEKGRQNREYKEKIAELEKERTLRLQKINRMEHTIDALATMTDTQKATKEQALLNFQDQIDQLQENAHRERIEFEQLAGELKEAKTTLQEALSEKLAVIKKLEDEISWQYGVLQEKDQAIHSQSHLFSTSQAQLNSQLQDLTALLELETLKSSELQKDQEIAAARQMAQEMYSKALENRFHRAEEAAKQERDLAASRTKDLINEYLHVQGLLDVYSHAHDRFSIKHEKLAQLIREGNQQTDALQQELNNLLVLHDAEQQRGFCLEEELHETAQKAALLQDHLEEYKIALEKKHHEHEMFAYSHGSLKDQLQEKINQLNQSLEQEKRTAQTKDSQLHDMTIKWELERTRSRDLDHQLRESILAHRDEAENRSKIEDQHAQKAETVVALENRLLDKQSEIGSLREELEAVAEHYEQERLRSSELHKALIASLSDSEAGRSHIQNLRGTIDKNTDSLVLLQDRIESKKSTIQDLQDRMDHLSKLFENEKDKAKQLEQVLAEASVEKDSLQHLLNYEKERSAALEQSYHKEAERVAYAIQRVDNTNEDIAYEPQKENVKESVQNLKIHKVAAGESLRSISNMYYRTPNRWIDIYNANKSVIPNKERLQPGTQLTIPK